MATIHITPCESQIWKLVVSELIKKEIAATINCSEHTVSVILRRLFEKLKLHKETDLVREYFVYYGYVTHQEISDALKSTKAVVMALFLGITMAQLFEPATDNRPVRSMRTARTGSRTARRSKDYYYD